MTAFPFPRPFVCKRWFAETRYAFPHPHLGNYMYWSLRTDEMERKNLFSGNACIATLQHF